MALREEVSIHPKEIINHFHGHWRHPVIDFVDEPSSFLQLGMDSVNNLGHLQFRVTDLQHNQGESRASYQLSLYKTMDLLSVFELVHQLRKRLGLNISREHSIVDHGQSLSAKIKVLLDLACTILECDNLSSTVRRRPKIGAMIQSKLDKCVGSRINPLVFGISIQKRTYSTEVSS
jgi:hypothetical protein